MKRKRVLNICPVCGGELEIAELKCSRCGTVIRGKFLPCEFCNLDEEKLEFLRIFLKSRGNLSEVAKKMGISHPTARHRLLELLLALGYEIEEEEEEKVDIFELLERGEISVDEAIEILKGRKKYAG